MFIDSCCLFGYDTCMGGGKACRLCWFVACWVTACVGSFVDADSRNTYT